MGEVQQDSGEWNAQSKWCKYTHGERAYYHTYGTEAYSFKSPPEDICNEEAEDAKLFERGFRRAGKQDSGEWNAQSEWVKNTHGERAYYHNYDTDDYSLKLPPEGICWETEENADDFEEFEEFEDGFREAGEMDSARQSQWKKTTHGAHAFYYHVDKRVYSLKPPEDGFCDEEEEEDAEKFEWDSRKAEEMDSGGRPAAAARGTKRPREEEAAAAPSEVEPAAAATAPSAAGTKCDECGTSAPTDANKKTIWRDLHFFRRLQPTTADLTTTRTKEVDKVLEGWSSKDKSIDTEKIDAAMSRLASATGDQSLPISWASWKKQRRKAACLCADCWTKFVAE